VPFASHVTDVKNPMPYFVGIDHLDHADRVHILGGQTNTSV
jgi:hypothetical protein